LQRSKFWYLSQRGGGGQKKFVTAIKGNFLKKVCVPWNKSINKMAAKS